MSNTSSSVRAVSRGLSPSSVERPRPGPPASLHPSSRPSQTPAFLQSPLRGAGPSGGAAQHSRYASNAPSPTAPQRYSNFNGPSAPPHPTAVQNSYNGPSGVSGPPGHHPPARPTQGGNYSRGGPLQQYSSTSGVTAPPGGASSYSIAGLGRGTVPNIYNTGPSMPAQQSSQYNQHSSSQNATFAASQNSAFPANQSPAFPANQNPAFPVRPAQPGKKPYNHGFKYTSHL